MYWQKRFKREDPDQELEEVLLAIRSEHKDYGYRRMVKELECRGYHINKKKVQRLMKKLGIQVRSFTTRSRKYSSYRGRVGKIATNRLRRRFKTSVPNQKMTTDTTEFKYMEEDEKGILRTRKLYLDPYMDLYNLEIISYRISEKPNAEAILAALAEAVKKTEQCPYRRTFHSDQGWAYQMKSYVKYLKKNRIFQSMSRKGNCLDNSVMENFFGIMKQEMYYGKEYRSFSELQTAIEEYIEYYNHKRMKERLNWLSPVQYRLRKMNMLSA